MFYSTRGFQKNGNILRFLIFHQGVGDYQIDRLCDDEKKTPDGVL